MPSPVARWDLFCRVIDNFGDIGVCWRLARELAQEHDLAVTLWLDDLGALEGMAPTCDPGRDTQRLHGIVVRHWHPASAAFDLAADGVADVVVEGFGCGLPERYVAAMARQPCPPRWFVLEYLSAETWVDGVHGRASPHPMLGLPRRFWFPGFTAATGGLLRERGLLAARARFADDAEAQRNLWTRLGVPPPVPEELRCSLFCYPNPRLPELLSAWACADRPVTCLVPEGVGGDALAAWAARAGPPKDHANWHGTLAIHRVPFVTQDEYDRLLWACDLNFVRGEDSFVRAQWAGRPLVWHVYPQSEGTHLVKLDAFAGRYCAKMREPAATAWRDFVAAWNEAPGAPAIGSAWRAFAASLPALAERAPAWGSELACLPELGAGLVSAARVEV